jgi:ABC-type bacteriocin/lantibiotic exporter with double-glycine peptidase domain
MVAVVGGVGAGKSTLINSILGEGRPLTGTEQLAVKGKLGTFVQTPFIMNDTVRNNILFGHAAPLSKEGAVEVVDEERYKLAVHVSSLSHDLKLLPHGDQTEIGEKGITLSGGQKARVAIARTIYHDADVTCSTTHLRLLMRMWARIYSISASWMRCCWGNQRD